VTRAADLFRRAVALLQARDPSVAALLPELERFPAYAEGWLALGEVLHQSGQTNAALASLGRAAQSSAPGAHRLGQVLVELGRGDAALAAFVKAVALDPGFAAAWYSLALSRQDKGEHAEAAEAYAEALRQRPDFHEAALNLGIALQEAGKLEAALDAYGVALRLRPDSFGRIAQALASGRTGALWLDPSVLRRDLLRRGAIGS
jgi:tetratricopeptide (TPR) repeat protein